MVYHICLHKDTHILSHALTETHVDYYYLFIDLPDAYKHGSDHFFLLDTHPQYSPDQCWILTDTYHDRFRQQSVLVYDARHGAGQYLVSLRTPSVYRYDVSCNFHSRWSRDERYVCFDSSYTGISLLCIIHFRTSHY